MFPLFYLIVISAFLGLAETTNQKFLRHGSNDNVARRLNACSTNSNPLQCRSVTSCIWARGACHTETTWRGFIEIGQTHVIKARGETRHAPKIISEREAELLFFPTKENEPTIAPSSAPTATPEHVFGLEKIGDLRIDLPSPTSVWPSGYPVNKARLIDGSEDAKYFPAVVPDVNFNFDLKSDRAINAVYVKIWYYSRIGSIKVGLRPDDGAGVNDPNNSVNVPDSQWTWVDGGSHMDGLNKEVTIDFEMIAARYVQIRVRNAWRGTKHDLEWGLRMLKISGSMDGSIVSGPSDNEGEVNNIPVVTYFPDEASDVMVEVYDASGGFLGALNVRPTSQQRGIMDQSQTEKSLPPYSGSRDMWSATLPWQFVKEKIELIISVPYIDGTLLAHTLILRNVASWSEHTLIRQKFVVFGTEAQFDALNTFTFDSHPLATGMFGIMPVASLNWVDATDLHWPYLVVETSLGPRKVSNERERRSILAMAGDDPGDEPGWELTKNMVAFRHSYANTGSGFTITTLDGPDNRGSPYSTHTSIAMGWAMVADGSECSFCQYKKLGYWSGWSAAAWVGWCGMKAGDECGNTISHEIGHSMTLNHFTTGTAASWGISDEYPQDGTNLASHPWGYDSPSRQFRTWYDVTDGTGKHDPMNGGGDRTNSSCFNYYTAYHGQQSQNWGFQTPQILSSDVSSVPSDGLYLYNTITKSLDPTIPEPTFLVPVETGIPVITFIGTLGSDDQICQTYPPSTMSYGHTFRFPDPFSKNLSSIYNGAAYMVEVKFGDGSSEFGLIASPYLRQPTDLRFYSFNVAISRRPTSVNLYRFNTAVYPSISPSSAKTLLNTRIVSLAADPSANLPQVTKAGRGWLGHSGDIHISKFCFSDEDCRQKKSEISWRGSEGINLSFSPSVPNSTQSTASFFTFVATRVEDGTLHQITIAAARYVGNSGWFPLLGSIPAISDRTPDLSHGAAFWLPYERNANLPHGKYVALAPVAVGKLSGSPFVKIRVELNLSLPLITDIAVLEAEPYTSEPFETVASSIYFLTDNPDIGPTEPVWWGDSRATLTVPLVASDCNNAEVSAKIQAQNKCGTSYFQMNAGRGKDDCPAQSLYLALDDAQANPWLEDPLIRGCRFETRSVTPVSITAYRWHDPNGDTPLGSMNIAIVVDLPIVTDTANLHAGPFTSKPFMLDSAAYFLVKDPNIGPTEPVWSGGIRSTLTIPLVAFNCNNIKVTAKILAQNKCGNRYTQMNARQGVTNCREHNLYLKLDSVTANPWLTRKAYQACKFQTNPRTPVVVDAYRWHQPIKGAHIASMNIAIVVDLALMAAR